MIEKRTCNPSGEICGFPIVLIFNISVTSIGFNVFCCAKDNWVENRRRK
jgi:hypothetical protein